MKYEKKVIYIKKKILISLMVEQDTSNIQI